MSTQGRPPTAVIELRCNHKTLALLAEFYRGRGMIFRSKGQFLRRALEDYCDILVSRGLARWTTSTEDAVDVLDSLGMGNLNHQGRNLSVLGKEILEETSLTEGESPEGDGRSAIPPVTHAGVDVSSLLEEIEAEEG